ncbi:MAG: branched-chain amino acid ABC transporter permease [candidate division WOR-3 bacterium]
MEYFLHILVIVGIYAILAMSLDVIVGYTGIPVLGHSAFSLIGAYTSSLLALNLGISPWLGLLAGGILASLVGIIVTFPALRLKGDYLALATFGLGIIAYSIAKNWVSFTRGPMGLPGIPSFRIGTLRISEVWQYLILVIAIAIVTYLLFSTLLSRPFGLILKSIREDEIASQILGKNTRIFKLKVFMVCGFFAGIAGSLYAHYITFIDPSSFMVTESIAVLLMIILGGMGTLKGAIIGAVLLITIPEGLRFIGLPSSIAAPLRQILYGFILVVLMIYRPQGIIGKYKWRSS